MTPLPRGERAVALLALARPVAWAASAGDVSGARPTNVFDGHAGSRGVTVGRTLVRASAERGISASGRRTLAQTQHVEPLSEQGPAARGARSVAGTRS